MVRFQLQRLNDVAAVSLFDRTLPPRLAAIIGEPRIIQNEVYKGFRSLISRFANATVGGGANLELLVETPRAGTGLSEALGPVVDYKVQPLRDVAPTYLPQSTRVVRLARRSQVPPGFRMVAGASGVSFIWRYMNRSDIVDFGENLRLLNLRTGRDSPLSSDMMHFLQREIELIGYVTRNGWPEDLIVITGGLGIKTGCGEGDETTTWFEFHPRELLVDVGIIENTGARPITLSDFRGGRDATEGLRALVARRYQPGVGAGGRLDIGDVTLSPGARVALPLRLLFASPESVQSKFQEVTSRDRPRQTHYIYGPEWGIASFALDGERIELARPSANHLALRIAYGEMSCPYLFVYDSEREQWKVYGKIIEQANGEARENTDVIVFPGLALRFRIGELEPELACIRDIKLTIDLQDGSSRSLAPSRVSAEREGEFWKVYFGEHIDFEFEAPREVNGAVVSRSVLSVRGYYERYLDLQVAGDDREGLAVADVKGRD